MALAACAHRAEAPPPGPARSWVQAAADGSYSVRAIAPPGACPTVRWSGGQLDMAVRVAPATVPPRVGVADAKPSVFDQATCEATLPAALRDGRELRVGDARLRAPMAEIRHIVLLADTGCRMKAADQAFQDCNDPAHWPLAALSASAAAQAPQLVIHVGDIHYRESPCPPASGGCAGSPWGYGQDVWDADFFAPVAPLLAAAPWVFVRGNHESCSRAGVGWFRHVDARPWSPKSSCQSPADDATGDFTEPYAVALSADTQLIVFDSAAVARKPYAAGSAAAQRLAAMLARADELAQAKPHSLFLNHHPVLGFAGSDDGQPGPGNAALQALMAQRHPDRLYADGVDAVFNGHYHLFEALDFASGHPATWVTGNGSSASEGRVDPAAALRAQPAPGAVVQGFATQPGFGYTTLDREAEGWRLTEWNVAGQAVQRCRLQGARLACD